MQQRHISIIVPVFNEEETIQETLKVLFENSAAPSFLEILVVDGGSTDRTVALAKKSGATIVHSEKGRAKQMNLGARRATGKILYFLHVDTLPPPGFDENILNALAGETRAGCFRMCFDSHSIFLRFFAWCTRFNHPICRGGDQSLFIFKDLFWKMGGFNEDYMVYEDNEFIGRLYEHHSFTVLPQTVSTSARRYLQKGILRLQFHFGMIHLQHFLGARPETLYAYYRKHCAL